MMRAINGSVSLLEVMVTEESDSLEVIPLRVLPSTGFIVVELSTVFGSDVMGLVLVRYEDFDTELVSGTAVDTGLVSDSGVDAGPVSGTGVNRGLDSDSGVDT